MEHISERLRKLAEKNPVLRGLTLAVTPLPNGQYSVPGRRQPTYLIRIDGDNVVCECRGYVPGVLCAHVVAVREELKRSLPMKLGTKYAETCNICRQQIPAGADRIQDPRPGKATWTGRDGKERPNAVHPHCVNAPSNTNGHAQNGNGSPKVDGDVYGQLRHVRYTLTTLIEQIDEIAQALKAKDEIPF